jgi:hypothetical protein
MQPQCPTRTVAVNTAEARCAERKIAGASVAGSQRKIWGI